MREQRNSYITAVNNSKVDYRKELKYLKDIILLSRGLSLFDQALFRELEDKSRNAFNNPLQIIEFTVEFVIASFESRSEFKFSLESIGDAISESNTGEIEIPLGRAGSMDSVLTTTKLSTHDA